MRGARGGPAEGAQDGCPAAAPPGIAPSIFLFWVSRCSVSRGASEAIIDWWLREALPPLNSL